MSAEIGSIVLEVIRDGGAQMREAMSDETVAEYAAAMLDGAEFPPVVVYFDGNTHWLADGYHRLDAARQIDRETIDAEIRAGSKRDAVLHGAGANAAHGLRRTNEDKRKAVIRLLSDGKWSKWSDRKIARHVGVDGKTVARIRAELAAGSSDNTPSTPAGCGIPQKDGMPSVGKSATESLLDVALQAMDTDAIVGELKRRGFTVQRRD